MNIVDQVYIALVYIWSELDKMVVGMGLTAYIVAVLKGERKHREALLCGVFAMIAGTALTLVATFLGLAPDNFAVSGGGSLVAGAIGWYGTVRTVDKIEDKFGGSKDDSNKE